MKLNIDRNKEGEYQVL